MNPAVANALAFVESHGVVLVSAKGPAPRLVDFIAGESISGNWWSHPRGKHIYSVLPEVCESRQVLVCRLVNGKVTLVHRKLWPALVCLAGRLSENRLAQVREQHTETGRHAVREVPFPEWVPAEVVEQAKLINEAQAIALLGRWLQPPVSHNVA